MTVIKRRSERKDPAATWAAVNPVLAAGEWAYETDAKRLKIGDGTTAWNALGYLSAGEIAAAVNAAVAGLVASAPAALDTLNELATALGNDANFATTITSALAGKQPLDADLTAIAALTTTTYGRSLLAQADAAAARTTLALGNVDNTSDVNKPVSTAQAAADTAEATARAAADKVLPSTQVTADYSPVIGDAGKSVQVNAAAATTVTIPANATVPYPVDTVLWVSRVGAGTVTVVGAAGVTLVTGGAISVQGAAFRLHYRGSDTWSCRELVPAGTLSATYVSKAGTAQAVTGTIAFTQPGPPDSTTAPRSVSMVSSEGTNAPLHIDFGPNTAPGPFDRLLSFDFPANGFPGPITSIMGDGGIVSGAYLIVSGSASDASAYATYQNGTPVRSMAALWMDTVAATVGDYVATLSLRSLAGQNNQVIHIIEDINAANPGGLIGRPGNYRWLVTEKGDTHTFLTAHTDQPMLATNYERAHLGWDTTNSRYLIATEAGGTGTRRKLSLNDVLYVDPVTGRVGVGDASPTVPVSVAGSVKARLAADVATISRGVEIVPAAFDGANTIRGFNAASGTTNFAAYLTALGDDTMKIQLDPTAATGGIRFMVGNGVAATQAAVIDVNGLVGIGVGPVTGIRLNVGGSIQVNTTVTFLGVAAGSNPFIQATSANHLDIKGGSAGARFLNNAGSAANLTLADNGDVTHRDGANLILGTTTGTKIGTATSQKIGFFNATPVVQPSGTPADATDLASAITLVNNLKAKLVTLGLVA